MMDKIRILTGGDTCLIGRNESLFQQGDATSLLNDLLPEFDSADLSIVNLECPLIREDSPIEKVGPNLGVREACVSGLKAMGIDVVGLANNHIMDHGIKGLRNTIKALEEYGIAHVGAGENVAKARKILLREVNGIRIGILAVAEREFGIASEEDPGANPLDVIDFVRNIHEHRSEFDKLIVLVHGGNEHYQYPRPGLMDTCRFLVEQGASAVICQHSHCIGCMETYQGAPIIYGQGNLLFDMSSDYETWHEGALILLEINQQGELELTLIPYRQSDDQHGASRLTKEEEEVFFENFAARSKAIADASFVEAQWETFCQNKSSDYLNTLHGKRSLLRRIAGKLDLLHYMDSPEKQFARLNMIRCESHREALITVLSREVER